MREERRKAGREGGREGGKARGLPLREGSKGVCRAEEGK
jgi:hypothetical protein